MHLFIYSSIDWAPSESGHCYLEEGVSMAITVSVFMTLIQEIRKQICNPKSSSKCPTLVTEGIFNRIPLLRRNNNQNI